MAEEKPTSVRSKLRTGNAGNLEGDALASLPGPILGISPFDRPDVALVSAVTLSGATGVLDLGRDPSAAAEALAEAADAVPGQFGVRIQAGAGLETLDLPEQVSLVVCEAGASLDRWASHSVLVQVTSLEEARAAVEAGAHGVVAKGSESGGRIGEETAFVLLQRLVSELSVPIWVQGGVGLHTAAACIAGGAAGVVLDSQLSLVRESSLSEAVKRAVGAMDGSETAVVDGYRIYVRPGLPSADLETGASIVGQLGADFDSGVLGAGQDAAFARSLAERFATAGGVVRAVRRSMFEQVRIARAVRPLAPGSPFAAQHGTDYPIAQGPMTRVSDRAAFADAVSAGGGLPFLALALMRGPEVRELLEETAERLGDRPWGVGILGFVPPELREEQLEVVRELRPPVRPDRRRPPVAGEGRSRRTASRRTCTCRRRACSISS